MFAITLINTALMALTVLVHYEFLRLLTLAIPKLAIAHRYRIVIGVFGALIAHVIEVWLFGLAYYGLIQLDGFGELRGNFDGSVLECVYFSFTNYTTLGYGDIEPIGPIRFLTGIESLTGLVMITWTASFLFFEMQRHWKVNS
ncbi:MAG: two pore domain potassium channel family protein [Gammaproteobacteria bacterium]|nr:two pore domain potassium channel family protein [Gammaproteobacteria bacterium]NVK89600.1 two pore domain potassium channel family protein [Gammaproteobacteria bacterium]